jgi:S-DNA-T family DNA segregation ATPase FtsK/SpoIIIE
VVTDPKKAAGSLQWAVTEMLRRYKMMSDMGVRDLESYNSIVTAEEDGQKLPQVVIIIDELADLMMVAAKEVEDSICRIAQMGRAAGMHLIIATQRPSANVITGLMKANIPSRIAFSVASAMESRIILDTMGAEKLVGKGDMLYAPIGAGKPIRVQGCFLSDSETERVVDYIGAHSRVDFDPSVIEAMEAEDETTATVADADDSEGLDDRLAEAIEMVIADGQASISMLQRRMKIGYARAGRLIDDMAARGIVSKSAGSKPREVLISREEYERIKDSL